MATSNAVRIVDIPVVIGRIVEIAQVAERIADNRYNKASSMIINYFDSLLRVRSPQMV